MIMPLEDFLLNAPIILIGVSCLLIVSPYLLYFTKLTKYEMAELRKADPKLTIVGGYPFFLLIFVITLLVVFLFVSDTYPTLTLYSGAFVISFLVLFHGIFATATGVYPIIMRQSTFASSKIFYIYTGGKLIKMIGTIQILFSTFILLTTTVLIWIYTFIS